MAIFGTETSNAFMGKTIVGTDDSDSIYGRGGNDVLFGLRGKDYISGGTGDDQIFTGNGTQFDRWGADTISGGDGSDTIVNYWNFDGATIYGDHATAAEASYNDGSDTIWGGLGGDTIIGGGGANDTIYGEEGNDYIVADYGIATTPGYYGSNTLVGGMGQDTYVLTPGQSSWDTIVIANGDSRPIDGQQDVVSRFGLNDRIDLPSGASSSSYNEATLSAYTYGGFDAVRSYANSMLTKVDYVYLTDGQTGYLFADTMGDSNADIGVTLAGLRSLSDFGYGNII